ncbi:MAG: putative esterase [Phycisphaerae bacterium]|nr:putative esterase [Phycisphaerae bacterium]
MTGQPVAPQQCEITFRVRYAETDPMGVLHHSRYFVFFEMGRTELLRQAGFRYRDLEIRGVLFVVFKAACQYRQPAHYDDELRLVTRIDRVTRSRIDHSYELVRVEDGRLICTAQTTLACVGRDGQVIAIPEDVAPHLP